MATRLPRSVKDIRLIRSHARRNNISLKHTSQPITNISATLGNTSNLNNNIADSKSNQSEPIVKNINIPLDNIDKPSTDLKRPLRGIYLKLKRLPGFFINRWHMLRPPLTPDQIEQNAAATLEKQRDILAIKEARIYARQVKYKLAQLGMKEILNSPSPDKPKRLKLVRFRMVTRDELFTKIVLVLETDPRSLPAYVQVSKLAKDPLYSDELLPTLNHFVRWDSTDSAVTLTIFRHGLEGLPNFIAADDIYKKIPENKPPLTFPVGYAANSMRIDIDLDDCPHLIVAGATKQGKSNFINQMICYWLWRGLTPMDIQLVLFDLKRGLEFSYYEKLPHLYNDPADYINQEAFIKSGIIEDMPDVLPAMNRLRKIMDDRLAFIKYNGGHKDVNSYNRSKRIKSNKIPAMVVVFDEWARISLRSNEASNILAELTNMARAAGMYFIIGTQNPTSQVINSLTGVNFNTRVIFKCSVGGSMAALGNQAATDLDEKGRAILQDGGSEKKLQTPRISDSLIKAIVYKARTGKTFKGDNIPNGIDLQEIFDYSLSNLDGELDVLKLYNIFKDKNVRQKWLQEALKEAENKTFILSGQAYTVSKRGNHIGRRLILKT